MRQPAEIRPTLAAFDTIIAGGLALTDELVAGVDQLRRIGKLAAPDPSKVLGLSDGELYDAIVNRTIQSTWGGSVDHFGRQLAAELVQLLEQSVPDLLDQIRGPFDAAAAAVHEAARLGITPSTTSDDIIKADNCTEWIQAWRGLVDHVEVLERIAQARINIARLCDPAAPGPRAFNGYRIDRSAEAWAGAFFSPAGATYTFHDHELPWQRWIRLCTGVPAQLLTPDKAAATQFANAQREEIEATAARQRNAALLAAGGIEVIK